MGAKKCLYVKKLFFSVTMSILKRDMFDVWCRENSLQEKNAAVLTYVLNRLHLEGDKDDSKRDLVKEKINSFSSFVSKTWKNCNRTRKVFENKYSDWLDKSIIFVEDEEKPGPSRGRPSKHFMDLGDQRKKQKLLPLLQKYSTEELTFAARRSLEASGRRNASQILKELSEPEKVSKIKKAISTPTLGPIKYTPEEALGLFIDSRLTKKSYIIMQQGAKQRNANIYPNYNVLLEAKKKCYPNTEFIIITDTSAEVKLQALVNHTTDRIIESQKEVFKNVLPSIKDKKISLIHKWGCDGSAGHSTYKQRFSGDPESSKTDFNLFSVCLVPLQMTVENGTILWQNNRTSSTRFCRPIKLIFEKETPELTKEVVTNINQQISEIEPTNILQYEIQIYHTFKMTMIDGKLFSVVSESSTQTCGICGATPKVMNNLESILNLTPNENLYDYGISTLHAWIRCLECCLHISYKITIKKWQIREDDEKNIVKQRKQEIIQKIREELNLLVDIPKQGYGTTNDGNTARKFFRKYSVTSAITGVDEEFLKRLYVILTTMCSGYEIDVDAFTQYCMATAKLFVERYPWYYMPSSLHRILIHGPQIIKAAPLPIGMFSEEALESRNKDFRKYRESYSRKFSRSKTMSDVFCRLLLSSDPYISSLSQCIGTRSNKEPLTKDVLSLLQEPNLAASEHHDSDTSDSDGSEQ